MDRKKSRLREKPINELTDAELLILTLDGGPGSVEIRGRGQSMWFDIEPRKRRGGPRRDPSLAKLKARISELLAEGKTHPEISILLAQEGVFRSEDANRKLAGPKKRKQPTRPDTTENRK